MRTTNTTIDQEIIARRAAGIAQHGPCDGGCSFWDCGREMGHAGPCYPAEPMTADALNATEGDGRR